MGTQPTENLSVTRTGGDSCPNLIGKFNKDSAEHWTHVSIQYTYILRYLGTGWIIQNQVDYTQAILENSAEPIGTFLGAGPCTGNSYTVAYTS